MEYNFKGIGSRISKERKAAGFKSQQAFIDYLQANYGYSICRNTLSAIENGNHSFLYIFAHKKALRQSVIVP